MRHDFRSIAWRNNAVVVIDQTRLPGKLVYLRCTSVQRLWKAISRLEVRGAPALGVAGALGVYLGARALTTRNPLVFSRAVNGIARYLATSRPTARNLFWGIERALSIVKQFPDQPVPCVKRRILVEALKVIEEDRASCRAMGSFGARLIKNNARILTVCNAGVLATIDYGTALGVMYAARAQGKRLSVYACETRPLLQGARLTAWELTRHKIPVTLICDNMAATLMAQGKIDCVITGADRIASAGDAANKIGTYALAVLARYHRLPFYVAAPRSTFDMRTRSGDEIVIEERPGSEITDLWFTQRMAPRGIATYNPAFDVTPHSLITAFITDKGIIRPPFLSGIRRMIA